MRRVKDRLKAIDIDKVKSTFNSGFKYLHTNYFSYFKSMINIFIICYNISIEFCNYKLRHKNRFKMIKDISHKIESINIVYVKLFQIIANNTEYLDDRERDFLIKYTDQVNYNDKDIDYITLNKLRENDNIFIEETPCNSGIVALAYRGFYKGEKIIVKLLKLDIENRIMSAISDLELLFSIFKFIPYLKKLNLANLLNDNKNTLIDQIYFNKEIESIERFYQSNRNIDWLVIPKVYTELSNIISERSNNIIVMKYIDGIHLSELSDYDKEKYVRLIIRFSLVSLLYNSAVHCDLHSGNIIFIKEYNNIENAIEYKLGIIDFGIVIYPSRDNQNDYYIFLKNMFIDNKYTIDILNTSLFEPKSIINAMHANEKTNFINNFNEILQENINKNDIDPIMIFKWVTLFKKYNIKFSDETNKLVLSLLSCSETVRCLAPNKWMNVYKEELEEINKINKLLEI